MFSRFAALVWAVALLVVVQGAIFCLMGDRSNGEPMIFGGVLTFVGLGLLTFDSEV